MTIPIFPSLVGQGWSAHKKPRFDTRIAAHVTGREARARKYARPLWDFELTFDGLDATADGTYGALGAQSFQTLAGFFLSVQGRYVPFLYQDPSDSVAGHQVIGVGDGSTRAFTFIRSIGEFTFPVDVVTTITGLFFNGVSQSAGWGMIGPNVVRFDIAPAANVVISATFTYAYGCRFSEDVEDFEEFGVMLMDAKTITFQAIRDPLPILAKQKIVIFLLSSGVFHVPLDFTLNNKIEVWGGGGGASGGGGWLSGGGGGGGAYAWVDSANLTPGAIIPYTIGAGGSPALANGNPGGLTTFGNPNGTTNVDFWVHAGGGGYLWFGYYGGNIAFPNGYNGGNGDFNFGPWADQVPGGGHGGGGAAGPGGQGAGGGTINHFNPGSGRQFAGAGGGGASGGGQGADITTGPTPGLGGSGGGLGGGAGGNGAADGMNGAPGANGVERFSTAGQVGGSGGGGGGGGGNGKGGDGGGWGGGGGGGGPPSGLAGKGHDGAIVISYTKN